MTEEDGAEQIWSEPHSAISKAFRLLDILVGSGHSLTLIDIAEQSGMPKPSAHRLLSQLEDIGIVKRDMTGKRFLYGDTLRTLAMQTLAATAHKPIVREIMIDLVSELGESCNLGVLDGRSVVYIERVECDRSLRMHLRAGSRVPPHCTSLGKLLLAMMPEARAARFVHGLEMQRFTANTIVEHEALLKALADIRTTGFSVNREEFQVGLTGAAVPIPIVGSASFIGLAVHAPVFRMSFSEAKQVAKGPLRKAAAAIAAEWQISGAAD